jgi:BirA family biotin operon repressor/biotin-[acetyl-CoA-carboxylase] ligase
MPIQTRESRLDSATSTMDEARRIFAGEDFILATAGVQTSGKGTRGRTWQSPRGNVHMTVGIHRRHLPPSRLALLPLEIGVLLFEEARSRLAVSEAGSLSLKWPNDLLLRGAKVAGVLMESHGEVLLCGIGINVAEAPPVSDGGSPSARLADAGMGPGEADALADGIYGRVVEAFTSGPKEPEEVLMAWQARCDWTLRHRLRDRPERPWVEPVSLNTEGHLLVRHLDGSTEWLVSEYLS